MRIAVLILGLVFTIFSGLQSCAVHVGGRLADSKMNSEAGAVGVLISMLFLLGSALVIGYPRVAQACFALAAVIALLNRTNFPDMGFWGVVAIALSAMCWFGHRELQRRKRAPVAEAP